MNFFPPLAGFDPPYPIAPDGYLPNSVLLQQLRKSEEDQRLAEQWQPPSLSDKQRRLMAEMEEMQEEEEEEAEEEVDSDLMARLQAALEAPAESIKSTPTPTPPPSPPPPPPKVTTHSLPLLFPFIRSCHCIILTERAQVTDEGREAHCSQEVSTTVSPHAATTSHCSPPPPPGHPGLLLHPLLLVPPLLLLPLLLQHPCPSTLPSSLVNRGLTNCSPTPAQR